MNDWKDAATAPQDGSVVMVCTFTGPDDDWSAPWNKWAAPQSASFCEFHPNAPGKRRWRDKNGKPVYFTHWQPLPPTPNITKQEEAAQ